MKLHPFSKKTTTGYYDRIKAECDELAQQAQEAKQAAADAKADYEAKARASYELESRSSSPYLSDAESKARRVRDDAYNQSEALQRKARDLESRYINLRSTVEAPARMEEARQTITRLSRERDALRDEVSKTESLIGKLQRRVEELEQRIAHETQAASQSMVETEGEFVMPESLTRLDVELRVTRATLAERQTKLAELQAALKLIPDQLRNAKRAFSYARATVADIELQEQLPNWLDVIALAAVSASTDAREYVIKIPSEIAEAARAKLAAELPSA
jgi:chromosome segregation ATPase